MKAIINADGKITIPKKFREEMEFLPGVEVDWKVENGNLVLLKKEELQVFNQSEEFTCPPPLN